MASCQLQKPPEQTCNQKANENSFGHKVSEMAHKAVKTFSEHKQNDHQVVTCQTQTHSEYQVTEKTQVHSQRRAGSHGKTKSGNGLKERIREGKEKVKSLLKRRDSNGGSSCSSSSESESEDDTCHCPKKASSIYDNML